VNHRGRRVADQVKDASDEDRLIGGLVGSAAGVGDRVVDGARYSFGQSLSVDFMSLAGGLLALGATYMAVKNDADERVLTMTTAVGTAVGYALSVGTQPRGGRPERVKSFGLNVMPYVLPSRGGLGFAPRLSASMRF
jgi:hypothetical protein